MKMTKTAKTIIRKTWKAWELYAKYCWERIRDIPKGTKTATELWTIAAEDGYCKGQLGEWYALSSLAEELGIDWQSHSDIDEETAEACRMHEVYTDMFFRHRKR